jgi:predicted dehydrogenase
MEGENMESTDQGSRMTRRQCLRKAAGAFMILPAGLIRGYAANDKLDIGVIGLAGIGAIDARTFLKLGENVTALCDVDSAMLDKRIAEEHPKAKKYTDFRKMIEGEKLDGVVVATPDHSHAYISVLAMKHGLHVYCQKPLCQTVHEARVMARVAAETKVITQMGTQGSASESNLRTVELIQSGAVGEITEIHLATDRPIWPQGYDRPEGEDPVPSTLDWDIWLGPSPMRPFRAMYPEGHPVYNPPPEKSHQSDYKVAGLDPVPPVGVVYHPFVWRGWTEFGSGALGDIAPHQMNVVFWALDLGAPSAVEVVETSGMRREMYPDWTIMRFEYAARGVHPPLRIFWYDGGKRPPEEIAGPPRQPSADRPGGAPDSDARRKSAGARASAQSGGGVIWIGTKGSLPVGRGPYYGKQTEAYPTPPERDWGREEVHKDWTVAVKANRQAPCHFGYAGPFTEAYQLGNIALRVGHRIEWDPLSFRITNCREANRYLSREYRRGWDLREIAGSSAYDVAGGRA